MKQKIFKPDYQNSLVSLSNSILKHYGLPARHQTLPELDAALAEKNPRTVILLVLDGMGTDMLEHNLPENSFLRSHIIKPISSVYPPTTAAATTSIYSGLPPLEHGWAGWQCYFEEYGRCVELFRNFDYYTQQPLSTPSPEQIMGFKRLNEQIAESGAAEGYGVAQPWGNFEVKSFDDICRILEKLSRKDEKKFVLAYWKNPDGIMHKTGCYSEETKNCITSLNAKLEALYQALEDSMLIVTADHGLLDIKDSVLLNEIKELDDCLRLPPALNPGRSRFMSNREERQTLNDCSANASAKTISCSRRKIILRKVTPAPAEYILASAVLWGIMLRWPSATSSFSIKRRTVSNRLILWHTTPV